MPQPAKRESHPRRLPPILRRAWFSLNQAFRHRIAHLGITPDQYSILRWLHEGDTRGLTQQALTERMSSDPNTITSILRRMEKSGLISREQHETDGRAMRVRLKPRGRRAFTAGFAIASAMQGEILKVLPPSRRARFLADLEAVADACSEVATRKRP